mmetsp:Transcript_54527/g.167905  ORF Transcript_54527/g.167905 Transcript_54527/m.167905 type:complete len:338 (-) Transcript_54527:644-1657(-)
MPLDVATTRLSSSPPSAPSPSRSTRSAAPWRREPFIVFAACFACPGIAKVTRARPIGSRVCGFTMSSAFATRPHALKCSFRSAAVQSSGTFPTMSSFEPLSARSNLGAWSPVVSDFSFFPAETAEAAAAAPLRRSGIGNFFLAFAPAIASDAPARLPMARSTADSAPACCCGVSSSASAPAGASRWMVTALDVGRENGRAPGAFAASAHTVRPSRRNPCMKLTNGSTSAASTSVTNALRPCPAILIASTFGSSVGAYSRITSRSTSGSLILLRSDSKTCRSYGVVAASARLYPPSAAERGGFGSSTRSARPRNLRPLSTLTATSTECGLRNARYPNP